MAEDKNYTNNKERPRENEELEIDLMEYVRKLWAARKVLLKAAGITAVQLSHTALDTKPPFIAIIFVFLEYTVIPI